MEHNLVLPIGLACIKGANFLGFSTVYSLGALVHFCLRLVAAVSGRTAFEACWVVKSQLKVGLLCKRGWSVAAGSPLGGTTCYGRPFVHCFLLLLFECHAGCHSHFK
jgi:hypothetical protein